MAPLLPFVVVAGLFRFPGQGGVGGYKSVWLEALSVEAY